MKINFIANYQHGYVGEQSDECHLADSIEAQGHEVVRVPRDIWKAICDGDWDDNWKDRIPASDAEINIMAKWPHFNHKKYIVKLKEQTGSPVFYWVWDYMWDQNIPEWHLNIAREADLYLSGEGGLAEEYKKQGVRHYYFQFDVCDGNIPVSPSKFPDEKYDLVFTGSWIGQGDRLEWLKKINKEIPITVFSWNHEEWKKNGFDAHPAIYGEEYNKMIADSKVVLGFSVNPHCWGYWSNRVGKVVQAGGLLLYQYAPGMEILLHDVVGFFSSPEEAIDKARLYIKDDTARSMFKDAIVKSRGKFTSDNKISQLLILITRFLIEDKGKLWNQLP